MIFYSLETKSYKCKTRRIIRPKAVDILNIVTVEILHSTVELPRLPSGP